MSVWMFPGQGSQHVGMGAELFARYPDWVQQADATLGYSIQQLCLHDSKQQLDQTQYTQPALYVVNAMAHRQHAQTHAPAQWLLGHSLGEYNALLAAGVFDFVTGLQLVQQRGALMSQQQGGSMAVCLGLSQQDVQQALQQAKLDDIDVTNINTPQQIVIAGPKKSVADGCDVLTQAGAKRVVPLAVSGAFHSRYMQPAQQKFTSYIKNFTFTPPKIPVIANITALPYEADSIHSTLVQQIVKPVRWADSINFVLRQGQDHFEELGPGKVLSGLLRKIRCM